MPCDCVFPTKGHRVFRQGGGLRPPLVRGPCRRSEWSHWSAIGSSPMATAFVAAHRGHFSVRAMCRCLRIQPSGVCAWLQALMSARAQEDRRQTELLRSAWAESGKVCGYRKLHDDLVEQGESICPRPSSPGWHRLRGSRLRSAINAALAAMAASHQSWSISSR